MKIPSLKLFAYEPDYELLMKLVMENIGESPQTVVSENLPDPYWDQTVWLIVEVKAEQALVKTYNGTRKSLEEKFIGPAEDYLKDFMHKNPQSLAMLTLKDINFKMNMKKCGNKLMLLNVKEFDLYDMRYKTKIGRPYRKILGSYIAKKFRFEDDTTSYADADTFQPENVEDFDINLEEEIRKKASENEDESKKTDDTNDEKDKNKKKKEKKEKTAPAASSNKKEESKKEEQKDKLTENEKRSSDLTDGKKEEDKNKGGAFQRFWGKLKTCCKRKKKDKVKGDDKASKALQTQEEQKLKGEKGSGAIPQNEKHYMSLDFNPLADGVVNCV